LSTELYILSKLKKGRKKRKKKVITDSRFKIYSVMWGRTYTRGRRARDVRRAAERQGDAAAAVTTAGASAGISLGSG